MKRMVAALLLAVILTIGTVLPAAAAETAVGAWAVNHKAGSYLSASEKKIFDKAVKDLVGVVYTPVLTLGKQVVSGTNYAFLCTAQTVTASPSYSWKVLIVNRSVKGKVKLVKVNSFSYKSVKTRKNIYKASTAPGAWSYSKEGTSSKGAPTAAKRALKKATKQRTGISLTALALLGKQVVAGTNYRLLCRGTLTDQFATSCLYVADVYQTPAGDCELVLCEVINLPKYLKY